MKFWSYLVIQIVAHQLLMHIAKQTGVQIICLDAAIWDLFHGLFWSRFLRIQDSLLLMILQGRALLSGLGSLSVWLLIFQFPLFRKNRNKSMLCLFGKIKNQRKRLQDLDFEFFQQEECGLKLEFGASCYDRFFMDHLYNLQTHLYYVIKCVFECLINIK